jgi:asparagine synthase (glutamine-hydrolysing)
MCGIAGVLDWNQPLFDNDRQVVLSYNGEVYNYLDVKHELESAGITFRTKGDTEVILEAYKRWGVDCVRRFNGMFAFALWDIARQRLFLARDRAGEKPLFYTFDDGRLAFASEPQALRPAMASPSIDPIGLAQYLTLNYSAGDRTLLQNLRRLPPGHTLVIDRDAAPRAAQYWDLAAAFKNKRSFASEAAAADELRARIDQAVTLRLVSDVPLGAFLSGGVDSSAVVSSMARTLPASQVHTFSIGFGVPSYDEVDAARAVATGLGVHHQDRIVTPTPEDTVKAIVAAADEPLADTSVIPTYTLARFARESVTVALSGDGADECLGGYETYLADRLHHALRPIPGPLARGLSRTADALLPVSFSKVSFDYKVRHFLAGLHLPFPRAHASWRNIFGPGELASIMQPSWREIALSDEADPFHHFKRAFDDVEGCHYLDQASYVDIKTWLADDILVKVDRATMAHSLEARAPLLDHTLMEFAASLPADWKLNGTTTKYLLKKSQAGRVPAWVLSGKKKGFNAPVTIWLEGPLRDFAHDALNSPRLREWIRADAIDALWRDQAERRRDNGLKLFGLITLSLWLNRH